MSIVYNFEGMIKIDAPSFLAEWEVRALYKHIIGKGLHFREVNEENQNKSMHRFETSFLGQRFEVVIFYNWRCGSSNYYYPYILVNKIFE